MSSPTYQSLELERDGPVTWLRLARPARLNALTEELFGELAAALREIDADGATRAVVLTGKGRGFCAGSDVAGLEERFSCTAAEQLDRLTRLGRDVVLALHGLAVPTIAAVNGAAAGGGLSLALACDVRLASEQASFTFAYGAIGLVPDLGASYFLPRVLGLSRAHRLLWTNARLSATDALAAGLVDEVVAVGELAPRAADLATRVAAAPQLALRLGRIALRRGGEGGLEEALDAEAIAQSICLQSTEHREAVRAFAARRAEPPSLRG